MPTFQGFFLENNNDKEPESHAGQKVNSKREEDQEILILCRSQKVNIREEEHLTSGAQKSQKVTSTTHVDTENKPKSLNPYAGKKSKVVIREQSEQYS